MDALDYNAAHGTAGLIRFDIVHRTGGAWDLLAHYAGADDNARPWTATYGPFDIFADAEEFARNLPLPGQPELGPAVESARSQFWIDYSIYPVEVLP